ncbi:hypothetical protein MAHJHV57_53570 [Mycobacterium avium subsp. hominissuis]
MCAHPLVVCHAATPHVLDVEDMRRRCVAHDQWMRTHPEATAFSEAWADRNLDELAQR